MGGEAGIVEQAAPGKIEGIAVRFDGIATGTGGFVSRGALAVRVRAARPARTKGDDAGKRRLVHARP